MSAVSTRKHFEVVKVLYVNDLPAQSLIENCSRYFQPSLGACSASVDTLSSRSLVVEVQMLVAGYSKKKKNFETGISVLRMMVRSSLSFE